jgi:hypothetical protein
MNSVVNSNFCTDGDFFGQVERISRFAYLHRVELHVSAMYLHPATFPGACDTQTLYLSKTTLKKLAFSG